MFEGEIQHATLIDYLAGIGGLSSLELPQWIGIVGSSCRRIGVCSSGTE